MPFELRPVAPEQALEAANLVEDSFENNMFRKILFPDSQGLEMRERGRQKTVKALADPECHVVQIFDTDTEKMAGYAVWVYTKPMTDEDWEKEKNSRIDAFPGVRRELLTTLIPWLQEESCAKKKVMGHDRWWELEALSVLPEYQRRGIGSRLMKWGTDRLEKMNASSVIVATEQGIGLYKKHGYKVVETWGVDLTPWGVDRRYLNSLLMREPGQGSSA